MHLTCGIEVVPGDLHICDISSRALDRPDVQFPTRPFSSGTPRAQRIHQLQASSFPRSDASSLASSGAHMWAYVGRVDSASHAYASALGA